MTPSVRRFTIVSICAALVMTAFVAAAFLDFGREMALQRERDTRVLMDLKSQLERSIVDRLRYTDGIAAYVKLVKTVDRAILDDYFERLIPLEDHVFRNVAVIKGSVIGYQYPLEGNEKSIGVDLLTIPEQREAVLQAMSTLETTLNGPVDLVQGGRGLVMRVPIALEAGNPATFWGQISLVLRYDELMNELFTKSSVEGYLVNIEQLDAIGQTEFQVFRSGTFSHADVQVDMPIMTKRWRVSLHHKGAVPIPMSTYLFIGTGLVVTVLISWIMNKWLLQQENLNKEVESRTRQLRETNEILEQYVAEFEEKQAELELVNGQLESSIDELTATQAQLVVTEKLAALGDLVASLAHEINTPLGVCVTLYSFIEENLEQFKHKYLEERVQLDKKSLERFLDDNREALMLMGHNLKRSSELVASFKLVSMDQYLEEYRIVNLSEYVEEIVNSIRPKYKRIDSMLKLQIDGDIRMYTYPGAISQVLTNLINNSIIHGFDGQQEGSILVVGEKAGDDFVRIQYSDTGVGLSVETKEKIFQPFYTTKKHKGSSGLGMHIVYNAVVKTLGGSLELMETPQGFGVVMLIPVRVERDV